MWKHKEVGSNRTSKNEIRKLFPGQASFPTPKPEALLERVLQIGTNPGDLVLDCFGGSGTTAAVAHKMGRKWVTSEVQESNFESCLLPRLSKVVAGEDDGGITKREDVTFVGDLPEGVDHEPVRKVADALSDLRKHGVFDTLPTVKRSQVGTPLSQVVELLQDHPDVFDTLLKQMATSMRAAAKTEKTITTLWDGGSGFDVAAVAPSIFVQDDEDLFLADWAVGGRLAESVAAQVRYRYEPDGPFAGRKGRSRLAVLDGMLTAGVADFLLAKLGENESLLVVAGALEPGVDEHLRSACRGSRARKLPRDLARPSVLSGGTVTIRNVVDASNPSDEEAPEEGREASL